MIRLTKYSGLYQRKTSVYLLLIRRNSSLSDNWSGIRKSTSYKDEQFAENLQKVLGTSKVPIITTSELIDTILKKKGHVAKHRMLEMLRTVRLDRKSVLYELYKTDIGSYKTFLKLLNNHFKKTCINNFILKELMSLINLSLPLTRTVLIDLFNLGSIKPFLQIDPNELPVHSNDELKIQYLGLISQLSVARTNTLTAASMLLQNPNYVSTEMVKLCIDSLCYKNPRIDELQLDMIIKLQNKFDFKFNEFQVIQIMEKLGNCDSVLISKQVMNALFNNIAFEEGAVVVQSFYFLISKEFKLNNPAGCYLHWKKIRNIYGSINDHDYRILGLLITIFTKNKKFRNMAREIILEIPESEYGNYLLFPKLLDFAATVQDIDLANKICQCLKSSITRPMLSDLLKLHLKFGDTEGSEKVLNEIMKSKYPLTSYDYSSIVGEVLRKGHLSRAIGIVDRVPIGACGNIYGKVLGAIVDKYKANGVIEDKYLLVISQYVSNVLNYEKTHKTRMNRFWNAIAVTFMEFKLYKPTEEVIKLCRRIYSNSADIDRLPEINKMDPEVLANSKNPILQTFFTDDPFNVSGDLEDIILRFDERAKMVILKIIASASLKIKSSDLNWCFHNLKKLGVTPTEIIVDFSKKNYRHYTNIGLGLGDNIHKTESYWRNNGIDVVKKRATIKFNK